MIRTEKIKPVLIFLLLAASLTNTAFVKKIQTPETTFLDSNDIRKSPAYQKVLRAKDSHLEQAKFQYLLERIRKSPLQFVRNGEKFDGARAAKHLHWKLSRKGGGIKTASEFIDKIASESSRSGSPYLLKVSDQETYPLRDIMNNELQRLEQSLEEDRKDSTAP